MNKKWVEIENKIKTVSEEIFKKRRMERFLGCFYCGVL